MAPQQPRQMLNLPSIRLSRAMTAARAPLPRTARGARVSARYSVRVRVERYPERGTTAELPKPGDAGVVGIAACDGNDGVLAALPMPLGSCTVGLLAGPGGMPEMAELPAPADPAGGTWARDATGESAISRRAKITWPWRIDVFSKEDQRDRPPPVPDKISVRGAIQTSIACFGDA
jgi:hypothetical protein